MLQPLAPTDLYEILEPTICLRIASAAGIDEIASGSNSRIVSFLRDGFPSVIPRNRTIGYRANTQTDTIRKILPNVRSSAAAGPSASSTLAVIRRFAGIAMSLFLSAVALASGMFIAIAPGRAARIWGWENFDTLTPAHKRWYLRSFRFTGIVIALGGILNAVDSILFH